MSLCPGSSSFMNLLPYLRIWTALVRGYLLWYASSCPCIAESDVHKGKRTTTRGGDLVRGDSFKPDCIYQMLQEIKSNFSFKVFFLGGGWGVGWNCGKG